jgi:hypothetical protein
MTRRTTQRMTINSYHILKYEFPCHFLVILNYFGMVVAPDPSTITIVDEIDQRPAAPSSIVPYYVEY